MQNRVWSHAKASEIRMADEVKAPPSPEAADAQLFGHLSNLLQQLDGKRRAHILEITLDQTYPKVSTFSISNSPLVMKYWGDHDIQCLKTSTQASAPAPTDSYVQELTKKIRQDVVEVEAKLNQKVCAEVDGKINQTVQDNLTMVLKK
ncbi:hypothetical protein OROHE_002603 [Orobanche hederae]